MYVSGRYILRKSCLKVWSTVKIRRTKVLQNAIVPVLRPKPYSIIIINMRFIPKASLRASSQIPPSSYILERHLWVNNSKPLSLAPTWSLACKQTNCITTGMWKRPDPKLVLTPSKHKTFVWLYAMLDQRWRRCADVVYMLYKCLMFAGQEDFLPNIVHLSNVGLMLGHRRRRWPNINRALVVVSCNQFSGYINAVNLYSIGYCWPTLDRPSMHILQLDDSLTEWVGKYDFVK